MQTQIDCFPCFLRQTVSALKHLYGIEDIHHDLYREIMRDVLVILRDADTTKPPAFTTTLLHRLVRDRLGQDPFRQVKETYNDLALRLYPGLKEEVRRSADPLRTAVRLAIAGNIIDFGIFTIIDIDGSIQRSLGETIAVDDYEPFRREIGDVRDVLYLLDNAGEIVFDKILIEELRSAGKSVTAVVKGAPVLNDVTREDSRQTGLDAVCRVVDNGSDAIGTILPWTSPEFQELFAGSELIISKGQGNFETLRGTEKRTFFLFQSKCAVVSRELNVPSGSMLLMRS